MKKLFKIILVLSIFISSELFASDLKCADQAVETATTKNFKRFHASTNSCGAKLLTAGDYLETYLVCISDETDPSEWVVVIEKQTFDKEGKITGTCKIKFADVQFDSETPNFDNIDPKDLVKAKSCSADYGDGNKVICK